MSPKAVSNPDEELFLSQLPLIERVVRSLRHRHGLTAEEAEDLASQVKLKIVDDDYGVLRRFQGKSELSTYLTTVVHNQFKDFQIQKWGKWRPSAAAKRLGMVAVKLDQLLHRDGRTVAEAVAILTTNHRVAQTRQELEALAARLPQRPPRRFVGEERLARLGAADGVEERVVNQERAATAARVEAAMTQALAELPPEDRLILKLHFEDGFTVAAIAAALHLEQRPLYSRKERCLKQLRAALEGAGLEGQEVAEILGWEGWRSRLDFGVAGGKTPGRSV